MTNDKMTDFVRKAINFGHRNGLNIVELALAFSTGRRCNHVQYIELCTYFKDEKNCADYYNNIAER